MQAAALALRAARARRTAVDFEFTVVRRMEILKQGLRG